MLNEVAAAFDRQDYPTAARLLKTLLHQSPENVWVQFYIGRLQEASGNPVPAEKIYRQLLQTITNPKLALQARQGLQRLETAQKLRRQAEIAQATAEPGSSDLGFLVLEAATGDDRPRVIQNFARVTKLDSYTARSLVPSRGWRLYRTGTMAELNVYGSALRAATVPTRWAAQADVQKLPVFQVHFLEAIAPQGTIVCENQQAQLGHLSFDWSEVRHCVEGLLPIFEQVLELGYRDRLERKEKTQDYAHLCDLHLPSRRCILRFQDSQYRFDQGISVAPDQIPGRSTVRSNWNALLELLKQRSTNATHWSDFTPFAESAADFAAPLSHLKPQIQLLRQTEIYWDAAFQLYSSLIFLHQ